MSDINSVYKAIWDAHLIDVRKVPPDEPFEFAAGVKSPGYVSIKDLVSWIAERKIISEAVYNIVTEKVCIKNIDCVSGVAAGGVPFADDIGKLLDLPFIYVRKENKDRGQEDRIVGLRNHPDIHKDSKVLVIEDVTNFGTSSVSAVNALRNENLEVEHLISILDYGSDASENLGSLGVQLDSVVNLGDVLDYGIENSRVDADAVADYLDYIKSPKEWNLKKGYGWNPAITIS